MGTDDASVVDPLTMRVHGLEGLRVVDASVMPYVTNGNIYAPVLPRIHRGTFSSTLAVHNTFVRPNVTRHEPSAIAVKSRSKRDGAQLGVASAVVAPRHRSALLRPRWALGLPRLGVVELGSEEAAAEVAERLHVATGQEAVAARRPSWAGAAGRAHRAARRAEGGLVGGADQRDVGAHDVADHAAEERIVGAAEQQGVDVGRHHRGEEALGEHGHLVAAGLAAFDELDEAGARCAGEGDLAAGDHGGVLDGVR